MMPTNESGADGFRKGEGTDGSDKKSFQLVFWLFVAKIVFILLLLGVAVWLIMIVRSAGDGGSAVRFEDGFGVGYSKSGDTLWLGAGSGTVAYKNGSWEKLPGDEQASSADLLPVADGWYLVSKSTDQLTLQSEDGRLVQTIDVPDAQRGGIWAAGYHSQILYHLIEENGSQILFSTRDGGRTWDQRAISGLEGAVNELAAHPDQADTFAVATSRGLFVTKDGGSHFSHDLKGEDVSALSFGFDEPATVLAATFGEETALYQIISDSGTTLPLGAPTVESDRIIDIAGNPSQPAESAVLTENGDIYQTTNSGVNWTILAKEGRGLGGS